MNIKAWTVLTAIAVAAWGGVRNAEALTFYTGKGVVISATAGCGPWPTPGSLVDVNYRPGGLPSNGAGTETYLVVQLLGIVMSTYAVNAPALSDGVSHAVTAVYIDGLPQTNTGSFPLARTSPSVVSETTEFVTLTTRITRFRGFANCTVLLRSNLFRQLNQ